MYTLIDASCKICAARELCDRMNENIHSLYPMFAKSSVGLQNIRIAHFGCASLVQARALCATGPRDLSPVKGVKGMDVLHGQTKTSRSAEPFS